MIFNCFVVVKIDRNTKLNRWKSFKDIKVCEKDERLTCTYYLVQIILIFYI